MLQIRDTGCSSAERNMELDRLFLEELSPEGSPILHLYEWEKDSVSFGHFKDPQKIFHLDQVEKFSLDLARRPTGGGVIFHLWDFAFSLLVPANHPFFSENSLENYRCINEIVTNVLKIFLKRKEGFSLCSNNCVGPDYVGFNSIDENFCMACPSKYDILFQERKIVGCAQRKKKNGFLHQGSIALVYPQKELLSQILKDFKVAEKMIHHTSPLLEEKKSPKDFLEAKDTLKELLIDACFHAF